jgi:hypothetical protein
MTISSLDNKMVSEELCMEPAPSGAVVSREIAWKRLKSHPNAPFADLRLLAEVVAKKSNCPGPVAKTSEYESEDVSVDYISGYPMDNAVYNKRQDGIRFDGQEQPSLVPQDVLIECGRKRMTNVREDGIREALRLLDARLI